MTYPTIGFTGTREGMTYAQIHVVSELLRHFAPARVRHGGAIGADSDFATIINGWYPEHTTSVLSITTVTIHPCSQATSDMWLDSPRQARLTIDICPVRPPLDRNTDIVRLSDAMIATPRTLTEELRSGTWSTIRKARKMGKPLYLVGPDDTLDDVLRRSKDAA